MSNFEKLLSALVLLAVGSSFFVMIEPAPTDILMLGAGVAAIAAGRSGGPGVRGVLICGLIYYMATLLASFGAKTDEDLIAKTLFTRFYLLVTIYAVAAHLYRASWEQTDRFLKAMIAAGVICSLIVVLAKFHLLPHSEMFFRDKFMVRMKGTFKDPNVMGPFLAASLMMALFRVYYRRARADIVAAALLAMAIVLSGSRGALLTVGVQTLVFFAVIWPDRTWNARPSRTLGMILGAVIIVVGSGAALVQFGGFREQLAARLERQSYDADRFGSQAEVLSLSMEQPFGHGASSANRISSRGVDPHNVYLKVLYEAGIVGLLGFVGMLAFAAAQALSAWRCMDNAPKVRLLGAAVFATLVAHGVNSLFIDSTHWRHLFVLAGIGAAFPLVARSRAAQPQVQAVRRAA